ncbi:MAG: HAD hydrolase-like protein [Clostridiales bacterium]|nr:HAD hydrolase-like protein [Clostridiales bacterium]
MSYSVLLFDLDGTLTDPGLGITNAVMHALTELHIPVPPREELYRFIGPPLHTSFQTWYGLSREETDRAITSFRAYYNPIGVYENAPYPGVAEFLADLKAAGYTLALASSKPQHLVEQVLEMFHLTEYFTAICGGSLDERHCVKSLIVADALAACGVTDPSSALMIGDRKHDIEGARANGIAAMGVLYGYGNREEFLQAGADYICGDFEEMRSILLLK